MTVSMIVAAGENNVIGRDGALPWHLPQDARRFRRLTTGHPVVMGRVTYESIIRALGKPLPNRTSIVVSRSVGAAPDPDSVRRATSLGAALDLAGGLDGGAEVFIGGGVSIYTEALPLVDRIYLTRVRETVAGDRRLPGGWLDGFTLTRTEAVTDPGTPLRYEFLDYQREPG